MSESQSEKRTDWKSIYVTTLLSFVGAIQYNIYFSALWPYLETVNETATESFYGYIIAMYSIGQMLSATIFGFWSNKIKQVKLPICVGLIFMIIGNLIYLVLPVVPFPAKYVLLIGRFIDGIGSSNSAMLRLYASTASTVDDRIQSIGYFSCGQAVGAILGPVFQLAFSPLEFPGYRIFGFLELNIYTAPAYCAILVDVVGIIILYTLFKEDYAGIMEGDDDSSDTESENTWIEVPKYDIIAVIVCLLTRFAHTFFLANIETIGSAFSMHMFAFSHTKAVKYMAGSQTGASILTFFVYLAFTLNYMKRISLRCICISSVKAMILFYLITYSYPFYSEQVTLKDSSTNSSEGCPTEKFTWCEELSSINVYLYYAAYVAIIGLAFPTLNVALITLYSTVLGPRRQGTLQGIFQISGGTARMLGPFVLGNLYDSHGPKMTWKLELAVLGITAVTWIAFYRKMVPLKVEKDKKDNNNRNSNTKKNRKSTGELNAAFEEKP